MPSPFTKYLNITTAGQYFTRGYKSEQKQKKEQEDLVSSSYYAVCSTKKNYIILISILTLNL